MARKGGLRLIAGRWGGRRLPVADRPGLRPTPDRVRETLFNWLQGRVPGARCLDLFAGSGALGLEAASRGAARVELVERDGRAARALTARAAELDPAVIRVHRGDVARFLAGAPEAPFDLVFVDPPYAGRRVSAVLEALGRGGWLAPGARVYVEFDAHGPAPSLPGGWAVIREGRAGDAAFALVGPGEGLDE